MPLLTIIDAITSQPVTTAKAFVVFSDGSSANLQADWTGNILISNPLAGSALLSAAGYASIYVPAVTGSVALRPAAAVGTRLTFRVEPSTDQTNPNAGAPSAGAQIVFGSTYGSEALQADRTGTAMTSGTYVPGPYQVTVILQGYNPLTQTVTLGAGQTDVVLTLTKTVDAPAAATTVPAGSTQSTVSQLQGSLSAPGDDPYEYVYPNSIDGKYFQAAQARMYIGRHFVDELVSCQWMLSQNKIPIFGYRSAKFDAVGTGRSLVQGQIAVNFINEGYMFVLLQEFKRKISSQLNTPSNGVDTVTQNQIDTLVAQRARLVAADQDTTEIDTQLFALGKTSTAAATYIGAAVKGSGSSTPARVHQNAVYLDIPFDIQVQFEGAGRIVNKTLKNCFLGANDFEFAHDGKTLLETYSFIAREVS